MTLGSRRFRRPVIAVGLLVGAGLCAAGAVLMESWANAPAILLEHSRPPARAAAPAAPRLPSPAGPAVGVAAAASPQPGPSAPARTGVWIEVPALGIGLPLEQGQLGAAIPQGLALHLVGTADPGQPGNSYVYAHGLWGMFGPLLYARAGQEVLVRNYTANSEVVFHVSRVVGKVPYNDFSWVLAKSDRPMLTLQTCVDFNPQGDRWIVQAT